MDGNAPNCAAGTGTALDPFCDIMDAVAAATDGDTIHIAPGTYVENVVLDEDLTLVGTGGNQVTILDGSGSGCVVEVRGASVALAGLTLTNGTGVKDAGWTGGGGLFASGEATLSGCRVVGNSATFGGGIGSFGWVLAIDTTIEGNQAFMGGGVACVSCSGSIVCGVGAVGLLRSRVSSNTATSSGGGIWSLSGGYVIAANSLVSDNVAPSGAIEFSDPFGSTSGHLELLNSTVARNSGVGIVAPDSLEVRNSILWGNALGSFLLPSSPYLLVDHSLVEGGWTGGGSGNLSVDPLFVDPLNGDFHVLPGSPCIDAGNSLNALGFLLATDLDGKRRFIDGTPASTPPTQARGIVDMGAYEFGIDPSGRVRRR